MKIKEIAPFSSWAEDLGDIEEFKLDREIIKIENCRKWENGYSYAEITFKQIKVDGVIQNRTFNSPYLMIVKFDTEFEGETWEKSNE